MQVATCRRTDQLHLAIVADGVALHDPRKESNSRSCCRDKAAHAAFLPDLLFADAVQYPKTGLQVGGAGGFRVLVIVTGVCVVAAVDGTITVAGVDVELACVK